jgi:4-hydroxybenzoate polyprenyltransferase
MVAIAAYVTANFTVPLRIGMDPKSMLWLLPLVAAIAIVYKATKAPKIKPANFIKEVVVLFASIVVFMAATAAVLCVLEWLITE